MLTHSYAELFQNDLEFTAGEDLVETPVDIFHENSMPYHRATRIRAVEITSMYIFPSIYSNTESVGREIYSWN
jgi:hypothetical protein